MQTLYRITNVVESNGNFTHDLKIIATKNNRSELIQEQNKDIQTWQQVELAFEGANTTTETQKRPNTIDADLREFSQSFPTGGHFSLSYKILSD